MITRTFLILKQHRFEVAAAVALCLGVTVAAIVEALRLNAVQIPVGCDPYTVLYMSFGDQVSPACRAASQQWVDVHDGWDMNLIRPLPQMLPFLIGIILGAPLVAREIENGTAPLSWALAGSRRRWLVARMGAMVLLIVPLLLAVGLAADFLEGAGVRGLNPWANFIDYMSRGVPLVFWGLAAFAGTVALGTLLGRSMPAIVLALVVCVLARGAWEQGMNHYVLRPMSGLLPSQSEVASGMVWFEEGDLVVYSETYLNGKPWDGDINQWWEEHMTTVVDADGNWIGTGPDNLQPSEMPYSVPFGFHGNQYWPVVALECAILLLGSLLCAAIALFRVEHRRPY